MEKVPMRRLSAGLLVLLMVSLALAQEEKKEDPGKDRAADGGSGLELTPLVNMKAPLVVLWFTVGADIPLDDASAVEAQVYEDFVKRIDIRVLSREKTLKELAAAENAKLQECKAEDVCLIQIGKAVKAAHVVGVVMHGTAKNYRLILKCFALNSKPPGQLNSVVEGSLTELLIGGAAGAVSALFENTEQYAPIDEAVLAAVEKPAEEKIPAPPPIKETAKTEVSKEIIAKVETKPEGEVVHKLPERPGFFRRHLWSAIALGTGVVAAGVGVGFGVMSKSARDEVSWPEGTWDPGRDSEGRDAATIANVMFGVAGAAAVASLVLFFFFEDDGDESGVSITPTGNGVQALIRF
jgi:hypothetical protein